jgi:hybrid cluster-associated redox disulfide protein
MKMTVNKEMSIGQVLNMDATTANIFLGFGMYCLGCPHAVGESIKDACAAHGADADALVEKLNAHFAQKA